MLIGRRPCTMLDTADAGLCIALASILAVINLAKLRIAIVNFMSVNSNFTANGGISMAVKKLEK